MQTSTQTPPPLSPSPARPRPPGPSPLPGVGHLPELIRFGLVGALERNFKRYGDIFRLKLRGEDLYVVSNPELAETVLVKRGAQFPKKEDGNLNLVMGNGLVTNSDHASWLSQRRMIQPMFHRARLSSMAQKMEEAVERLLERLSQRVGESVDTEFEMMRVTLDIITRTLFSADVSSQAGQVGYAVDNAFHFAQKRIESPFEIPLEWPLPAHTRFLRSRKQLHAIVMHLIETRRSSEEKHDDLLDMLLEAQDETTGERMNDVQLRDEVLTLFAAGHETTAHTLSFALYALARNPTVRMRLEQEVDAVLEGTTARVSDLERLPYTRAVLDECMRLYPAAPNLVPRAVSTEFELGGYSLKAPSSIMVSIFNIHRNPDFWPNPTRFDPERFLDGNKSTHRLAFMPFGAGARKCIGNNLAVMEGQLILATLAQRFRFSLERPDTAPPVLEQSITLRPKGGMRLRLDPRATLK